MKFLAAPAFLLAICLLATPATVAATITVHAPDGEGRVFVDVVGKINDGDFETLKEKTDKIYPIGDSHPKKLVIVTLVSYGGRIAPAMQIGELVGKRAMLTFVPGDRTCASACALIWVAGRLRTVGDTPQIGFHAAYDEDSGRESGAANAVMGAYLRDLGFGYKAIHLMTHKGPTDLEWLTPDLGQEVGVAWFKLEPPRTTPIPPQQPGLRPPPQVIAAWSKLMPRPATTAPQRGNETVVVKRESPIHVPPLPEEVREPAPWTSPERRNETVVVKTPIHTPWLRPVPVTITNPVDEQKMWAEKDRKAEEDWKEWQKTRTGPLPRDARTPNHDWFSPRPTYPVTSS